MHDAFVRPYVGDILAVILVYTTLRAATPLRLWPAIIATLAIAFAIEFAQLFNLLDALNLRSNRVVATILGGSFDVMDLIAYTAGAAITLAAETGLRRLKPSKSDPQPPKP